MPFLLCLIMSKIEKLKERIKIWRLKANERRISIKALKKRIVEILTSRDNWKKKAEYYKKLYDESQKKTLKKIKNPKDIGSH